MNDSKINAGALQYVLFLSVVIALLLLSFLAVNFTENRFETRARHFKDLVTATQQGFEIASKANAGIRQDEETLFVFDETVETRVLKKPWGLFDLIRVKSSFRAENYEKWALLGGENNEKPALYLKDNNKPLVLVGNTKVSGTAVLPKSKTKRGNIAGNTYVHPQLIYGPILRSSPSLPTIRNRESLKKFMLNPRFEGAVLVPLAPKLNIKNAFAEPTILIWSSGALTLGETALSGNVCVVSDTLIRVTQNSRLQDVMLVAPTIEIADGTSGCFQAFASFKMTVGGGCKLRYPSSLLVYAMQAPAAFAMKTLPEMRIKSGTQIQGIVAYLSDHPSLSYKAQMTVERGVSIDGEVYCDQNTDLQARVHGSVYTHNFVAKQSGSYYQNHLYNAVINVKKLPRQYAGLQWKETGLNIAKWLD